MGMMTEFYLADRSEAQELAAELQPNTRWDGLTEWKGVDEIKLMSLYSCAVAQRGALPEQLSSEPPLATEADGAVMVFLVDTRIVQAMFDLDKKAQVAVATAWQQSEECIQDGWTTKDARKFVTEFIELASMATSRQSDVLLWMVL
jgi:hypothetical protein